MTQVSKYKKAGGGFANDSEFVRVEYDFAVDGGAIGVLDLLEAEGDMVIKSFHAIVKEAVTSAGAPTIDVGVQGGDVDVMIAAEVKGNLTLDSLQKEAVAGAMPIYLASGGIIQQEIKVAAYTAGKIEYVFELMKV